jgi:tRNA(fMet)-specific endonuclease VapC
MRKYLLDTGSVSDAINRRGATHLRGRQALVRGDRLGTCMPVLGELFAGIELSASREKNAQLLQRELPNFRIWPFDKAAAAEYGRIFAHLRRIGRPMQQVDMQIAAIALTLDNCAVVTKDSDFTAIPGLDVEDWSTE